MFESLQIDTLVLGARDWLVAAAILGVLVAILSLWSYSSRSGLKRYRFLAMLLKIAAVAALAFCLLEPMRRVDRPRPGANVMAIVVDNSRSMEIRPPGEGKSRIDRFRPFLASEATWQGRLAQDFEVRRYAFDDSLRAVEQLDDLDSQGNNSALADSLETLRDRFQTRPVAGMILFTDGLATDSLERLLSGEQLPFPIYPVVYGGEENVRDISIRDAAITLSSFELAPAGIEATIDAQDLAGQDIVVRLIDRAGVTLEKQTIPGDSEDAQRRVRFQFRPREPGLQFVRLRAMLASEDRDQPDVPSRTEVTTVNNTRLLAVDRGGGPFKILYVAGRPNWEFKFIRRALEEDVELDLKALVRIARKEPKFSFRDRGVESVNPLIAGFSDDEETAEQYDEPVLLRLGVEEDELKAGFPGGEEELFAYQAIILDDVEAEFFTQQQMLLMREFVAARGGGLMMLGGTETFMGGSYQDTPLSDVLPVYLRGKLKSEIDREQTVRYRLTREGVLEPWLRLRANQVDEQQRVDQMPDFMTWNTVAATKPGASVFAEIQLGDGKLPGLVGQRFGRGRSLALMVGDFWRWSMRRATEDNDDLAQTWRQMARWLTNDVPRRVEVAIENPTQSQQPQRVIIQLRDPAHKPMDNATIELHVTQPDGTEVEVMAAPDATRPGFYVAEYWSQDDGGYACRVEARAPDGEVLPPRIVGWTAQPSATEFLRVRTDRDLLQQLAERSGGEVVPIEDLDRFVTSLPTRRVPISESRLEPLWHRPWLVLFAISCLCIEWGLRRWKGLP